MHSFFTDIVMCFSVLCVIGNKCDLSASRQVPRDDAKEYASQISARYFETSALTSEGI